VDGDRADAVSLACWLVRTSALRSSRVCANACWTLIEVSAKKESMPTIDIANVSEEDRMSFV